MGDEADKCMCMGGAASSYMCMGDAAGRCICMGSAPGWTGVEQGWGSWLDNVDEAGNILCMRGEASNCL